MLLLTNNSFAACFHELSDVNTCKSAVRTVHSSGDLKR
jgi:hypothetical protein